MKLGTSIRYITLSSIPPKHQEAYRWIVDGCDDGLSRVGNLKDLLEGLDATFEDKKEVKRWREQLTALHKLLKKNKITHFYT